MNEDDINNKPANAPTAEEIKAQVDAMVEERLKEVKSKLDSAYGARDEAIQKATRLAEEAKQREMEALTAAGKHQEVLQMKLTAAEEQLKMFKERITGFERDSVVQEQLRGLSFRNDRSAEMAYRTVVEQLVQNNDGAWVHRTGVPIKDFVSAFAKDPEYEFLFQPKSNSGAGSGNGNGAPNTKLNKKVTDMTTQELMAAAQSGQFGQFGV